MKCKQCNATFHYCSNCGLDRETYPLSEGFCSEECLIAGGGRTYDEVDADDLADLEREYAEFRKEFPVIEY